MKTYTIYQLKEEFLMSCGFATYDTLSKKLGGKNIDRSMYQLVYRGICNSHFSDDMDRLDDLFRIFNLHHPSDFHGHSMSMSDIVELFDCDTNTSKYYYCDMVGWKEVEVTM